MASILYNLYNGKAAQNNRLTLSCKLNIIQVSGEEIYKKEEKAASLGLSLISNHAFVDENKRERVAVHMKIQKMYICYTIIMWLLWSSIIILLKISGNAFDVQNEQLFFLTKKVSEVINWISLIPVIPGLWVFAFIHSIKNKIRKYVVFDVISILFSVGLWFQYFVTHVVLILGGL